MKIDVKKRVSQAEFEAIDPLEIIDRKRRENNDAQVRNAARDAFNELLKRPANQLVKVTIEGIDFYIKRLSHREFVEYTLSVMRDVDGTLDLTNTTNTNAQHVLLSCVCEEDGTPFFEHKDMDLVFNNFKLTELVERLLLAVYENNPCMMNSLKKT